MNADPGNAPVADAWPDILSALLAGRHLSRRQAAWAMGQVMEGEATSAQVAALVVALRAKGEDAAEVAGLVDAMLDHAVRITVTAPALDIVGTGGDRAHMVNVSTMAAVAAAAAGARVVKHGNRAATSQCGSADVLEALGVVIDLEPAAVVECVETLGLGFCFAPRFHPAMRHAGPTRREIGIPTVFNILGPLANPAAPAAALIGCADERIAPVMASVLANAGQRAFVVIGHGGIDEIATSGPTRVWDATAVDGSVVTAVLDPADLGFAPPEPGALTGADAAYNAAVARAVLSGERDAGIDPVRDAVVLNAAAALAADAAARGLATSGSLTERVAAQVGRIEQALNAGAAADLLTRWASLTQKLATASVG